MEVVGSQKITISIITAILNGEKWINNCFESIANQTAVQQQQQQGGTNEESAESVNAMSKVIHLEVCVFDDYSTDGTLALLKMWKRKFTKLNIDLKLVENNSGRSKGVGYGRNAAIAEASGDFLCFHDVDDEMLPNRILEQLKVAEHNHNAIIGSKFLRIPANSTCRFTRWANDLPAQKLQMQIYTSNGPTVIMPTWFCHRSVYDNVPGGFCENGSGTPEDLIFFYKHLDLGGQILRVDKCLLKYRYHPEATTFSITAKTIWHIRLQYLMEHVLSRPSWQAGFTIWNAGKRGRQLFRSLPTVAQCKVKAFCDVDKNKINKCYRYFDATIRKVTHNIPIVHFLKAEPPLLICMKLDLTNGEFEQNLRSLNLTEDQDYILFT